ncbi:hypothetical protein ACWFMI_25045 [Nocardiopsis terrae]|uniref:hypothetical protein n=1 Tax=Streptomyces sp. NPDC057554 TaxID=3350538 RepID=UPI003692DF8D
MFTVDLPDRDGPVTEELRTDIAAAVTEAVPTEVPGARIRWASIGGRVPEVVDTAELNGCTIARQREIDRYAAWG